MYQLTVIGYTELCASKRMCVMALGDLAFLANEFEDVLNNQASKVDSAPLASALRNVADVFGRIAGAGALMFGKKTPL